MRNPFAPSPAVRRELQGPLVAMSTIGVLSDEAAQVHGDVLIPDEADRRRFRIKTDGTITAAYWRECARRWVEAHPGAGVTWAQGQEDGWPEFLVAGRYHVFLHRKQERKTTARSVSLDRQGPDTYLAFDEPISGLVVDMPRRERIVVRATAFYDANDNMIGVEVVAPNGKEVPLFQFEITPEDIRRQKADWLLGSTPTPWLDPINRLGSVVIPVEETPAANPAAAAAHADNDAAAEAQAPETGHGAVDEPWVGRRFVATPETQRPVAEEDRTEVPGESGETATS